MTDTQDRLEERLDAMADALNALDTALDDTHPEGDGCDICKVAEELPRLWLAVVDGFAALRQSQDMEAAALDAAWKSAEQSLPEHFVIRRLERQTDGRWEVWSGVPDPRSPTADYGYGIGKGDGGWGGDWAEGPTLVDALRVLAALAPKAEEAPR